MAITRRHFLESASLTVLAGAVVPKTLAQTARGEKEDAFSPERLTIFNGVSPLTFKSLIGEDFAASIGGQSLGSLTLLTVEMAESAKPAKPVSNVRIIGRIPLPSQPVVMDFTLRFQGPSPQLAQDTYTLNHPALGDFPLFIVPAGQGVDPPTYSAVINQLAPSERW